LIRFGKRRIGRSYIKQIITERSKCKIGRFITRERELRFGEKNGGAPEIIAVRWSFA
jgi:hypothetical protein